MALLHPVTAVDLGIALAVSESDAPATAANLRTLRDMVERTAAGDEKMQANLREATRESQRAACSTTSSSQ